MLALRSEEKDALTPLPLLAFATSFAMVGICTAAALQAGSNPLTVVTVRTLTTVMLLLAYLLAAGAPLRLSRRDAIVALGIGVPFAGNNYLINAAIGEIPVPLAVLIFYLWPAMSAIAGWMLRTEPFRGRSAAGLAFAFAGVALALDVELTAAQAKGVAYAFGAALLWATTFVVMNRHFRGRDPRSPTFHMSLTALALFTGACLITGDVAWPQTSIGWSAIAGVGGFYAFALIGLFAVSVKGGATRASFFMNFEPVASVLLAAALLGQRLAPVQLAGAALVISALFLFRPPARCAPASPSRRS